MLPPPVPLINVANWLTTRTAPYQVWCDADWTPVATATEYQLETGVGGKHLYTGPKTYVAAAGNAYCGSPIRVRAWINWTSTWETRMMKIANKIEGLMALTLLLMLGGCDFFTSAEVKIHNAGAEKLEDIRLEAGGDNISLSALESSMSKTVRPKVTRDSSLKISYMEGSNTFICEGDVYFTNGMKVKIEAEIGSGKCKVRDVTH